MSRLRRGDLHITHLLSHVSLGMTTWPIQERFIYGVMWWGFWSVYLDSLLSIGLWGTSSRIIHLLRLFNCLHKPLSEWFTFRHCKYLQGATSECHGYHASLSIQAPKIDKVVFVPLSIKTFNAQVWSRQHWNCLVNYSITPDALTFQTLIWSHCTAMEATTSIAESCHIRQLTAIGVNYG